MGEPSGDIQHAETPQPTETRETNPNFGLSVNGSQIRALAGLNYLEEYGFTKLTKPNILKRLNAIKGFVLEGKTQEATNFLQHLTPDNPVLESVGLTQQIIGTLSENVPIQDALEDKVKMFADDSFREFIRSLSGKSLEHPPKNNSSIFLTQLGASGSVSFDSNNLNLFPIYIGRFMGRVSLPLVQQHPLYIEQEEVLGTEGEETALAKLEVFAELAKRYPKVFTHMTGVNKLPAIIQSGHFGKDYGEGFKGNASEKGLFAEELTFKDATRYTETIQQLEAGNEITIPWNEINPNKDIKLASLARLGYNYPLHELTYIDPKDNNPVAIFSDQLPQEHKILNWLIDGAIDIKDKCLVGIWVTPQYKQHLLHWISTWTEEKRQEVFGERKPEEVLISSAKDLPPLEK